MVSVGIKELKAKLSSYIDISARGEQIIITEHGKEVAIIIPISNERRAMRLLADSGKCHWNGGKPAGLKGFQIKGKPLSDTILEERA
jgi:prevent-host-death family protein